LKQLVLVDFLFLKQLVLVDFLFLKQLLLVDFLFLKQLLLVDFPLPTVEPPKGAVFFSPVRYHYHNSHPQEVAKFAVLTTRHGRRATSLNPETELLYCYDEKDEFVHEVEELMGEMDAVTPGLVQTSIHHNEGHVIPHANDSPQVVDLVCSRIRRT
jgi:hypothetical protein